MTEQKDSTQPLIDEDTVKQAVEVLQKVVGYAGEDRRSGKERRDNLLMPYVRGFARKMLENLSSAKMLMFFLPLWTSVFFLWILFGMADEFREFVAQHPQAANDLNRFFEIAMDGFISWCTFTVSLGGTIIVVRETFKVSKLKALTAEDKDTTDEIKNMQE